VAAIMTKSIDLVKLCLKVSLFSILLTGLALVIGHALPGSGELAYVSVRDGNYEIYLLDVTTTIQHNLTNNPSRDDFPAWSPDGTQLAFVSFRTGDPQIYVMDAANAHVRLVTDPATTSLNPVWSPDGTQIAFTSIRSGVWGIYLVDADCQTDCEAHVHPLRERFPPGLGAIGRLVWSPDGRYLAMTISSPEAANIYIVNAQNGDLTSLDTVLLDNRLAWSADSRHILYSAITTRSQEITAVNIEDRRHTNLSQFSGYDGAPVWSANNDQVLFESRRDGATQIFRMNADGSSPQQLTVDGPNLRPMASPNGRWIAFESFRDGNANIYMIDTDGGHLRRLTADLADDRFAVWRPG
jgi:TolB protein